MTARKEQWTRLAHAARRGAAIAALCCGAAGAGPEVDVLAGLRPADFAPAAAPLAGEAAVAVPLDPDDWVPAGSPLGRSETGPTLTDLGVAGVAAEAGRKDGGRFDALAVQPSAVDLRLLATPSLREALATGGNGSAGLSVSDLVESLDGGTGGALGDALGGGLVGLPEDDLQDVVDALDDAVLGDLLGGALDLGGPRP
jgi:hypothetical protein